jgi:hypothetical protein
MNRLHCRQHYDHRAGAVAVAAAAAAMAPTLMRQS